MRILISFALGLALAGAAAAQDKKDPSALPKKGDAVVLNGCFRGGALEATDVSAGEDSSTPLLSGLTFRVTGKKDLLNEMKGKHENRLLEVRGKLKSDLQPPAGYGTKVGGMQITIGGPTAGAGARDSAAQQPLPVVEVSAFSGTGTSCAR
jgi:hypothetical protein